MGQVTQKALASKFSDYYCPVEAPDPVFKSMLQAESPLRLSDSVSEGYAAKEEEGLG